MPFRTEHVARQHDPGNYTRFFRKKLADGISAIMGIRSDGASEVQSVRFKSDYYSVDQAKSWLRRNNMRDEIVPARQNPGAATFAKTLSTKHGVKLKVFVNETKKLIELGRISVPPNQRGKGIGSKVMRDLTEWADANGYMITLVASDVYGSDLDRLIKFYERFGFEIEPSSNKRYGATMSRN